jgi:hypothetical protein
VNNLSSNIQTVIDRYNEQPTAKKKEKKETPIDHRSSIIIAPVYQLWEHHH